MPTPKSKPAPLWCTADAKPKVLKVKGAPLNYSAALWIRYESELNFLVREMSKGCQTEVRRLFRSETATTHFAQDATIAAQAKILTNALMKRFSQLFSERSQGLAESMVNSANRTSHTNTINSTKDLAGITIKARSVITGPLKQVMLASVAVNVGLIKSIASQYLEGVQEAVMRSITTGQGLQDLIPALQRLEGVTQRRARNIALDQTVKAYNNLNRERMKAAGIKKFEWLHTGGSQEPRQLHIKLSGQVFPISNPPVIDERTGERGYPGQLIHCHCRMVPVIEFNQGDDE